MIASSVNQGPREFEPGDIRIRDGPLHHHYDQNYFVSEESAEGSVGEGNYSTHESSREENDQGTTVALFVSDSSKCASCKHLSEMLLNCGVGQPSEQVSFTVIPSNTIKCLRAIINKSVALYLQPDDAAIYLNEMDPTNFSINFAWESLHNCVAKHGQACAISHTAPELVSTVPIYLIDLAQDCLIRASTKEEYAALSYVWGDSRRSNDVWDCSRENIRQMQQPGFFKEHLNQIAATVRDAMTFTKSMGLGYLWVDRCCIAQDDASEKHSQLRAMGSIYARARFVIIATEGDGKDGLRFDSATGSGIRASSHRAYSSSLKAQMGIVYESAAEDTHWATRGWTFQEQIFARRSFVFRGGILTFQCQKGVWQEGTRIAISHDDNPKGSDTASLIIHKWPNMPYFKGLLEKFVRRDLTFHTDSLDAFSGVLSSLEASFPNGFFYGLPEVYFDIGLLWQAGGVLEDRLLLARADEQPLVDLPSWSWARWKGAFDFSGWEAATDCLFLSYYNQNFLSITKIVDWKKMSNSSNTLTPITNDYGSHRALAQDKSLLAPDGWRREPLPFGIGKDCELSRLLRNTNDKFTHPTLGKHCQFRFPIPLSPGDKSPKINDSWTSQIHGRVQRAFLSIEPEEPPHPEKPRQYALRTQSSLGPGFQVGLVQLDHSASEDWSNGHISGEFIAISAAEFFGVPGQSVGIPWTFLDKWELNRRTKEGKAYEYYNVMLINRWNEVVTRKGLGRVQKALWESLDLEEVDIVLS